MGAWGGISTLGLGLSLLWTEGRQRGFTLKQIVDWTSTQSAKHSGLAGVKGQLDVGHDADLIVWDPDAHWTVRVAQQDAINVFEFSPNLQGHEGRAQL